MKVSIKSAYKSITKIQEFDIPEFVVLTGKNGSGKSHLMEIMTHQNECTISSDDDKPLSKIRYVPFGGLNPKVNEDCDYTALTQNRKQTWNSIKTWINEYGRLKKSSNWTLEQYFRSHGGREPLRKLVEQAEGNIDAVTEDFYNDHYEISNNEILTSQIASVFKLYQIHYFDNDFKNYLNEKRGQHRQVLTDEEFEAVYGPKPWELINKMLLRAGLTYQVNHPDECSKESDFHLHLTDINTGVEIHVNDLSTGEKVLMSLALSIYNTKEETARPDMLLLDEPDAPLHPEFSKILMDSITESIVKEAGVKVMISTHSPMTVALAPEESIFLMDKVQGRPVKVSKQMAVNILTNDLDNIRLSYEDRRQVFVESKYDVQYYNRIVSMLSCDLPTVPQFLPPRSSSGSNCDEVSGIVNELRKMGNDLVYGIKDDDGKRHSSSYVFILGEGKRYAIDNYVFDPIYVAFLLVRDGICSTKDMGLTEMGFVQLGQLQDGEIQKMIDYVMKELSLNTGDEVEYTVQSGRTFKANHDYFMFNGHQLEEKIKNKWPRLKGVSARSSGDNALKNYMLDHVCKEYPDYISSDFIELFKKIV